MTEYKYIITEDLYNKCQQFADNSVNTSLDKYARRNQHDIRKIKKDIRNGKIGEEGTYLLLSNKFSSLSPPDHNIYQKKDKSWSSDLKEESGIQLAVKSQDIDSALAYGDSWVFQFNNGGTYDCDASVFKECNTLHYVAFNSLNVPKRYGVIRAVVKIEWLHSKNLFKEMKLPQLRGNKLAVYFDDLKKYEDELFQL